MDNPLFLSGAADLRRLTFSSSSADQQAGRKAAQPTGRAALSIAFRCAAQGRAMPYVSGLTGATPASYCIQQTTDCQ